MKNLFTPIKRNFILPLVILFISLPTLHGTNGEIFYFSNLNLKDGLSQLSVLDICEDAQGFIWLATRNGLNRFDGEHFTVYKHDSNDPSTISDSHIRALLSDTCHNRLWVGTTNGLNCIDLATYRITSFTMKDYPAIPGRPVISFSQDRGQNIWIGTRNGLCLWKEETKQIVKAGLDPILDKEPIIALYTDSRNHLYIGTNTKGLFHYDENRQLLSHLTTTTTPSLSENAITSIFEDSRHHIWIGTNSKGANKWNTETHTITHFSPANSGLNAESVRCFTEKDGQLFMGTFNGLGILDLDTDVITSYNNFDMKKGNLSHYSVYSLYVDKIGSLWVGTYSGGVNYSNPLNSRFTFYHPRPDDAQELFGIYGPMDYDTYGNLWIATEGEGLLQFNPVTKESRNYLIDTSPQGPYNKNIIKSVWVEGDIVWCGTNNGAIYQFHIPEKRFVLYYRFDKNSTRGIYSLYRQGDGSWWLGTTAQKGLVKLTKDRKIIEEFPVKSDSIFTLSSVRSFLEIRDGVYLIGTRTRGFFKYDTHEKTLVIYNTARTPPTHHLHNNYITTIKRFSNGDIWIGTFGGGLYLFDEEKGITKTLTTKDGLPNNNVYTIIEYQNRMWVSQDNGISEIDRNTYEITWHNCFNSSEFLEFTPQGGCILPNGDIYFSGSNGFLSFNPHRLVPNQHIPPVVLTNLSVNNKVIQPGDDSQLLDRVVNNVDRIVLKHNQSNFSIAYCALNYIYHDQNQYAYKLIGHDTDWNHVGSRKEAYYTNIAPGEYTFQVIASNNDGAWNETGKSLHISILPPWWKHPVAYILYAILFLTITFVLTYYSHTKRRLEQNLRIKQIERQQLEEFHQTKVRLFTNFSHELRTPLTLIITPLEELLKQVELFPVIKQKLDLIFKNSQRLLLLVNQLMDLQKNQAGHLKLKVSSSDLNAFVSEAYLAFKQIADKNQVDFRFHAPSTELPAWFDANLLEKVVFNLLSNAFKFTKSGDAVDLTLSALTAEELKDHTKTWPEDESTLTPADHYILISVGDTGKGISKKDQVHIFTPFYQAEDVSQTTNNGTGIGLSLVQSIVRLHHGRIHMQSNQPKGIVFTVILPNDKQAYTEAERIAPEEPSFITETEVGPQPTSLPVYPNKKILIVEDNHEIRHYLRTSLEPHYNIIESDNGADAFDLVMKEFPDLVLSDIMMPGVDGLELCSLIKNDLATSHIPVILLTARTMVMHVKEGYLSGADDYIIKPFHTDVLLVRIHNLLSLREKLKSTYGKRFSLESMGIDTATSAEDKFMQRFFSIVEKHLSNPELKADLICEEMAMSRTNFYRKIKAVTELSPNDLIKNKRLEIAARMLVETDMNVSEVSVATGFSTLAHFTKSFRAMYEASPTEYIRRMKNN